MQAGSSIRKRADGRWEARYIKGKDENGKSVYGYVYAMDRYEAEKKRTEKLLELMRDENTEDVVMKTSYTAMNSILSAKAKRTQSVRGPMDENTALVVEKILKENTCGFPFLCCLYFGLTVNEVCALRYLDLQNHTLTVKNTMLDGRANKGLIAPCEERIIPFPTRFVDYIEGRICGFNPEHYVLTDSVDPVPSTLHAVNIFRRLVGNSIEGKRHPDELRATFIRRALEASLNIETVSLITGMQCETICRQFSCYIVADAKRIDALYDNQASCGDASKQHMNLLILGAGSHGRGVMETAQRLGVFEKIAFLDDVITSDEVIGKCSECERFLREYPAAFVAIGDNAARQKYMNILREKGFILPKLIHPDATISQSAKIGEGTVVMAQATVNANAQIGKGCILAAGSITNFGAKLGDFVHLDCSATVTKDAVVDDLTMVESGEIVNKRTS